VKVRGETYSDFESISSHAAGIVESTRGCKSVISRSDFALHSWRADGPGHVVLVEIHGVRIRCATNSELLVANCQSPTRHLQHRGQQPLGSHGARSQAFVVAGANTPTVVLNLAPLHADALLVFPTNIH